MRVAICTARPLTAIARALFDRLRDRQHQPAVVDSPNGLRRNEFDAGIVRYVPGPLAPEPPLYFLAARLLEEFGVPFVNRPSRSDCIVDKALAGSLLVAAGLPHPAFKLVDELGDSDTGPFVVKPSRGGRAEGIAVALTVEEARRHQRSLGSRCLAQTLFAAIRYRRIIASADAIFRSYVASIEEGEIYAFDDRCVEADPPSEIAELAMHSVRVLKADVLGVDVLEASDGRSVVLEGNYSFGFGHDYVATSDHVIDLLTARARP